MNKRFIAKLITILLVFTFFVGCSKKEEKLYNENLNLTKTQWIEDIDYLKKELEAKHKSLYHTTSKEELDKKFSDLKSNLKNMENYEIKYTLAKIVATIGDAHTNLNLWSEVNNPSYPIGVSWFGEDLMVTYIDQEYKELIGATLVAINDIPIDKVISSINELIAHENPQWLKIKNTAFMRNPSILRFCKIIDKEEAKFKFIGNDGKDITVNISPEVENKDTFVYAQNSIQATPIRLLNDEENKNNNFYWYKYIPEDKTLYFQYNVCGDKRTMGGNNESLPDFKVFSKELIDEINKVDFDKFIIDLRNNGGGNSSLMSKLADKLKHIDKLKDKTSVLISKETFSSGVMACISLKETINPTFFGEETGGQVNGYGDILDIQLPNSKLMFSYSTKYFHLSDEYKGGFTPNVKVEEHFDKYIKGIDEVYEAAVNYNN